MGGVLAAAILTGCGGSDTLPPGVAQPDSNLSVHGPSINAQSEGVDQGSPDQQTSGSETDQSAGIITQSGTAGDSSVATAVDNPSSSSVDDHNNQLEVVNAASQIYSNSTCNPGATSVSYEDIDRSVGAARQYGLHVPFPASGFGWNGARICDLEGSANVDVIELLVPYVKQNPDTDGVYNRVEWEDAASAGTYNYETRRTSINNLLLSPVPGYLDGTGTSSWKMKHDGTNLYIVVFLGTDGFSPVVIDSAQPWHDDSVEIYIDGDNSKGEEYDGVNDFLVSLSVNQSTMAEPLVSQQSPDGLRIFYRTGFESNIIRGSIMEVAINLESAGIKIGKPFGFDIHINEDDNGGDRDAKWGWFEKSGFDRSWQQPSALGTVLLTDCEDRNACGSYQVLSH